MSNRDLLAVQAAGAFCAGLGFILLLVVPLSMLFLAFSGVPSSAFDLIDGLASLILALITAITLASSGLHLANVKQHTIVHSEVLRTNWTVLVIMMALVALIGLWLQPLLSLVAGIVLLVLFLVRPAVIRLTS